MKANFKKSDIQAGMLVETANGSILTVNNAIVTVEDEIGLALTGKSADSDEFDMWYPLDNYDDDLKCTNNLGIEERDHDLDIVKVYGYTYPMFAMDNTVHERELLWSRTPDTKSWDEMTFDEKNEFCDCNSCDSCRCRKECNADEDAVLAYRHLLRDIREAIAGLNNENIRKLFLTMANIGVIPKKECDYMLGKIDDISCEEIARLGTYKVLLNDKDDDDEKKGDEDEFVRKVMRLFQ